MFQRIKQTLSRLSFRTGVIVLLCCIPCYILSFVQFALSLSTSAKGVLWVVLFGLAKTTQYAGLTILGVEGVRRLKARWKGRKKKEEQCGPSPAHGAYSPNRSRAPAHRPKEPA